MQELAFPLKVHVRRNGKRVIFVEHEHYGSKPTKYERERQDQTRYFCNWLRQTFPDLPTEFRATCGTWYRRDRAHRHFVAYDVTPSEFMLIKLAFGFETIKVKFRKDKAWFKNYWSGKRYKSEVPTPGFLRKQNIWPTKELVGRMAKNPEKYRKLTRNRKKVCV